jgi:hypothetical protein
LELKKYSIGLNYLCLVKVIIKGKRENIPYIRIIARLSNGEKRHSTSILLNNTKNKATPRTKPYRAIGII